MKPQSVLPSKEDRIGNCWQLIKNSAPAGEGGRHAGRPGLPAGWLVLCPCPCSITLVIFLKALVLRNPVKWHTQGLGTAAGVPWPVGISACIVITIASVRAGK